MITKLPQAATALQNAWRYGVGWLLPATTGGRVIAGLVVADTAVEIFKDEEDPSDPFLPNEVTILLAVLPFDSAAKMTSVYAKAAIKAAMRRGGGSTAQAATMQGMSKLAHTMGGYAKQASSLKALRNLPWVANYAALLPAANRILASKGRVAYTVVRDAANNAYAVYGKKGDIILKLSQTGIEVAKRLTGRRAILPAGGAFAGTAGGLALLGSDSESDIAAVSEALQAQAFLLAPDEGFVDPSTYSALFDTSFVDLHERGDHHVETLVRYKNVPKALAAIAYRDELARMLRGTAVSVTATAVRGKLPEQLRDTADGTKSEDVGFFESIIEDLFGDDEAESAGNASAAGGASRSEKSTNAARSAANDGSPGAEEGFSILGGAGSAS